MSISNLTPGYIYHVCVTAVSAANFQTSSAVLHIRTTPTPFSESHDGDASGSPILQAYVPKATSLVSPSAPVMSREYSGGQPSGKRAGGGRKPGEYAAQPGGEISRRGSLDGTRESLEQLAERLKNLQQENENIDKQLYQEEREHELLMKDLEEQRNELKQRVKEKDEASGELRKHVNKLESVNRTAQSERNKRERLLQQKDAERQKRKEDIARWESKLVGLKEEQSRIKKEKTRVEEEAAKRMDECRDKIADEQGEMKVLDEDIKLKGSRIKHMEDERRRLQGGDDEEEREFDRLDKERERLWEVKLANLRAQYASLISVHAQVGCPFLSSTSNMKMLTCFQAQQQYFEAQERLKWVTANRPTTTFPFPTLPGLDLDLSRRTSSRRGRHRGSLPSNLSSPANFPHMDTTFVGPNNYGHIGNGSPTFPPGRGFFNINNGMTIPDPDDPADSMRTDSGNPPMSPRADALLPSDLLGDEESIPASRPSSNQFPSLEPSAAPFENFLPGSRSPESSKSRPPSIFASPHGSLDNVPEDESKFPQEPESASQTLTGNTQSASRRLSGLFGFNRQRGKTVADGPPLLGTLKSGQSQSFPRNLDDEFDPIGTRRRRLSYTSGWANPMSGLFPRSNTNVTSDSSSDRLPSSRKIMFPSFFSNSRSGSAGGAGLDNTSLGQSVTASGYNQFSPRHDPIDPSILGPVRRDSLSPRPSSTYSFDNHLPKPTGDTQPFGWPASDKLLHRNSPLGIDWSSPTTWSRSQSRRPSIQHGSSGHHLPMGLPVTDVDFFDRPYEYQRPVQAPIGTRPPSSHRPATPKLNPAAPSFKTLFQKKPEKTKGKDGDSLRSRDQELAVDDVSPPESRRSKDSRSIRASIDDSLERVASSTPSESVGTKESFIQKITRKGSSSKFSMSWKDRSGLFSKKGDNASQGDVDEDGTSDMLLGKSVDSAVSSTFSTDKSTKGSLGFSFMRKSKKERAPSEYSEKASETGDEEASES